LGFRWKRTSNNRKLPVEKPVVSQRLSYFMRKKELEDFGFKLVQMG
jgi:hypothetical protein